MENERPKIGLGVYILNEESEVLLLHRRGNHGAGTWSAPGGHLEYGESFEECAIREAREEAGIEISELQFIGVRNDIFRDEKKHSVTLSMRAGKYRGEPSIMEPDVFDDIGWFSLSALPTPLFLSMERFLQSDQDCLCGSEKKYRDCHGK